MNTELKKYLNWTGYSLMATAVIATYHYIRKDLALRKSPSDDLMIFIGIMVILLTTQILYVVTMKSKKP